MKYFTLNELCHSNVAQVRKIENKPDGEQVKALTALVDNILDPLRELFGAPVFVNSGFRSKALNTAVGGVLTSQHMKGEAADIHVGTPEGNRLIFELIEKNLPFDQLIWEAGNGSAPDWVHVSYRADGKNRHQILKQ